MAAAWRRIKKLINRHWLSRWRNEFELIPVYWLVVQLLARPIDHRSRPVAAGVGGFLRGAFCAGLEGEPAAPGALSDRGYPARVPGHAGLPDGIRSDIVLRSRESV